MPTLVPMEEINSLEPGDTLKRIMQVRFHHHLLPLKLALLYNGKKVPVKLRPNIGYFVKPLPLDLEAFTDNESHLRGMFEYMRGSEFLSEVYNKKQFINFILFAGIFTSLILVSWATNKYQIHLSSLLATGALLTITLKRKIRTRMVMQ